MAMGREWPLTRAQRDLHRRIVTGESLTSWSLKQLRDWSDGCERMEMWPHTVGKGHRYWKENRKAAEAEIERRQGLAEKQG